jgi:hypothetical protein
MLKSQRLKIFCTTEEGKITEKSKKPYISRILNHIFSVKFSCRRPKSLVLCEALALFFLGGAKPLAFNAVEVVCDVRFFNEKAKD